MWSYANYIWDKNEKTCIPQKDDKNERQSTDKKGLQRTETFQLLELRDKNDLKELNIHISEKQIGKLTSKEWQNMIMNRIISLIQIDMKECNKTKLRLKGIEAYIRCCL